VVAAWKGMTGQSSGFCRQRSVLRIVTFHMFVLDVRSIEDWGRLGTVMVLTS
jgi:hypothetical protein